MLSSSIQRILSNINQAIMMFTILISQISSAANQKIDPEFTLNYFSEKQVRQITVYACWNNTGSGNIIFSKIQNYLHGLNLLDIWEYTRHIIKKTPISLINIDENLDLKSTLRTNYYKIGVVLDYDCPGSRFILSKFSAARLPFNDTYVWLIVTGGPEMPTTILRQLPLRVDTELVVALAHKGTYVLYDAYNYSYRHGGQLNVTEMGFWNKKNGLKNYLTQYKYKRRQNFNGMTLNFSTILTVKPEPDLETFLTTPKDIHLDPMSRYHYALVLYLRDIYNFTVHMKVDNSWGYQQADGTINGILGDIINGTVDASACHFQQRAERLAYAEYTVPTYGIKSHMFFRHPKKNTLRNQFLKPLEENVWWLALNLSIVCWIFLLVAAKIEEYYRNKKGQLTHSDAPSDTSITVIAAISQQGSSIEPNLFSGRIAFLTMFVWSLMMFQFYSASIVGSLLAPPIRFINTIWDLADSDLEVGYEDIAYMRFHYSSKDVYPEIVYLHKKKFQTTQKRKFWYNGKDGMVEVSKGGYAFSGETGTAYGIIEGTFTQEQICDVVDIPLNYPQYVSLVVGKHSPFKKLFNYGLRQMVQYGLVDHLIKIWTHRRPQCPESFRSQPMPVGLTEFSPAMFLMLAGMITAAMIMIVENLRVILLRRKMQVLDEETDIQIKSAASSAMSQIDA